MLDKKYEDILLGISKSLEDLNNRYGDYVSWDSVAGYHIRIYANILPDDTWFSKIDWLIDNGYIVQGKRQWCDMTDSYVETYKLTEKGSVYIEEMGRRS